MTGTLNLPVMDSQEMQKRVGLMLDEALQNGILEEALRTEVNILPLPLPSCPDMSCNILKKQIKDLLEDGVASGTFGLQQAQKLRDLMRTYNKALDLKSGGADLLLQHISSVQAETLISGFEGKIKNTEDPETIMRNILNEALDSGILEKALKEAVLEDSPQEPSFNSAEQFKASAEHFNFAPSDRLVDQPITSKSKLEEESKQSDADDEIKLQAAERVSDTA